MVTTTGIHLANRLGHALEAAFKGKAQYRCGDTSPGHVTRNPSRNATA
jgi:hypothetical protein